MITSLRKKLALILPVVVLIMILGLFLSRIFQPDSNIPEPNITITAAEAPNYIGEAAKVCGKVENARFIPQIDGKPTFINFGQPNPNQDFTAVIWGDNRKKWVQSPEELYTNTEVCVTGRIESHEGTPQIEVISPEQISAHKKAE